MAKTIQMVNGQLSLGGLIDASAILNLSSTTKGFLPPHLTTTQRDAISSPTNGLMIFNTTDNEYQWYNASGPSWDSIGSGGGGGGTPSTVNTTTATPTTLATTPIATNTTVVFSILVGARRTGGSSGTTGDAAYFFLRGRAKNIAGTVTLQDVISDESAEQVAWNADLVVSGTDVILQVTGATNNNITWVGSSLAVVA